MKCSGLNLMQAKLFYSTWIYASANNYCWRGRKIWRLFFFTNPIMEKELLQRKFYLCELATRTYGNNLFVGSIVFENSKGQIVDKESEDTKEIFCPFIKADDDRKPNTNFQTIRLRNGNEIDNYILELFRA